MDIQPTLGPTQQIDPAPLSSDAEDNAEGALSKLTTDFQTFLTMLTVQLENQDPLNPLESNEFAVQLATFSGVEQQVRTNDLLEQMVGGVGGLSEVAKLVGMEVRAPVPTNFAGDPITIYPDIPADSDQAVLVVSDQFGVEVSRMAIPVDNAPIAWGGTDGDGATVGAGIYSFAIETAAEGAPTGRTTPEVYTLVSEVRMENGVPSLVLAGGSVINPDDAMAIRIPRDED